MQPSKVIYIYDDMGMSSKTIYSVFQRDKSCLDSHPDIPYDPDDFGRCYRLLKKIKQGKELIEKVAKEYPMWTPFAREWDELTRLWEEESQRPEKTAPKLYKKMQELVKEARG